MANRAVIAFFGCAEMVACEILAPETTETFLVSREYNAVATRLTHRDNIVGNRRRATPIEYKDQITVRKDHRLVVLIHQQVVCVAVLQHLIAFHQFDHCAVEITQLRVAQEGIASQRPLTTCQTMKPFVTI